MKGSSALRAAYHSQFFGEIGHYLQYTNGTILFDMEKFYDNVDLARLMAHAEATGYPPILMASGMQMHMAQRELKCYSSFQGKCLPKMGSLQAVPKVQHVLKSSEGIRCNICKLSTVPNSGGTIGICELSLMT